MKPAVFTINATHPARFQASPVVPHFTSSPIAA